MSVHVGDYSYVISGNDNITVDSASNEPRVAAASEYEYIEMADLVELHPEVEQSRESDANSSSGYLAPINIGHINSDEYDDVMLPGHQHDNPSNYDELGFRPPTRPNIYDMLRSTEEQNE